MGRHTRAHYARSAKPGTGSKQSSVCDSSTTLNSYRLTDRLTEHQHAVPVEHAPKMLTEPRARRPPGLYFLHCQSEMRCDECQAATMAVRAVRAAHDKEDRDWRRLKRKVEDACNSFASWMAKQDSHGLDV